jgi:hypothetical protein
MSFLGGPPIGSKICQIFCAVPGMKKPRIAGRGTTLSGKTYEEPIHCRAKCPGLAVARSGVMKFTSAGRRLIAAALSPGLSFVTAWFSVREIAAVNVPFVDYLVVSHFGLDRSCFLA